MQTKLLFIYRSGKHIQTVRYEKHQGTWKATHFNRDAYMPFALHDILQEQKQAMIEQGLTWEWVDPPRERVSQK
ncbi:hypothetical protein LJ739_06700 [Aestuariibacter halophilus]|uniref:Uncharacterized protein n=1 Tax=Fluctibacter halophilus TaxID=226011 RepID=A0ABS8G5X8_9ALTE|nr:hypothetical protein [Aestuariibacter halophilus]MCC2615925.1 hypothetical protein [Aestuariibacter halophilus]